MYLAFILIRRSLEQFHGMRSQVHNEPSAAIRNLVFATGAGFVCLTTWGWDFPIARNFQDKFNFSNTWTAVLLAVSVLCGSLMRLPVVIRNEGVR